MPRKLTRITSYNVCYTKLLRTQNPKLKIIPAGTRSVKSTELLASQAMERLLSELAERYRDRVILFDSPPILATSRNNFV